MRDTHASFLDIANAIHAGSDQVFCSLVRSIGGFCIGNRGRENNRQPGAHVSKTVSADGFLFLYILLAIVPNDGSTANIRIRMFACER